MDSRLHVVTRKVAGLRRKSVEETFPKTPWTSCDCGFGSTDSTRTPRRARSSICRERPTWACCKSVIGLLTQDAEYCPKWSGARDTIRVTTRSREERQKARGVRAAQARGGVAPTMTTPWNLTRPLLATRILYPVVTQIIPNQPSPSPLRNATRDLAHAVWPSLLPYRTTAIARYPCSKTWLRIIVCQVWTCSSRSHWIWT
jgi:hypothetical protein